MNIVKASTSMTTKPSESSNLETECLFGESVEILDSYSKWVFCKLATDTYCGWLKKEDLGEIDNLSHRIISTRSFLFKDKDVKSYCIHHLPLGALLSVVKIQDDWAQVSLPNNHKFKVAYTPAKHLVKIDNKFKNWVSIAEKLLGTPYKWGGRDSLGIDCSALLQLSYQAYGQNIKRNTVDQIKLPKQVIFNINDLRRGFVVFWRGHVGIMTDSINCIHANAFHMETIIEPLNEIVDRMKNESSIIKMMNFN